MLFPSNPLEKHEITVMFILIDPEELAEEFTPLCTVARVPL